MKENSNILRRSMHGAVLGGCLLLLLVEVGASESARNKRSPFKKHEYRVPIPPPPEEYSVVDHHHHHDHHTTVDHHHFHHHHQEEIPPPPPPPTHHYHQTHIEFEKPGKHEKLEEFKEEIGEKWEEIERHKKEKLEEIKEEADRKLQKFAEIPEKIGADLEFIGRKIKDDLDRKKEEFDRKKNEGKSKGVSISIWKGKGGGGGRRVDDSSETVHHHHHHHPPRGESEEIYRVPQPRPPPRYVERDRYADDIPGQFETFVEDAGSYFGLPFGGTPQSSEGGGKGKGFSFTAWKTKGGRRRRR